MKKLTLSAKIIGGFGAVILMMLFIVLVYQYALSKTSSGFEKVVHSDVATLNKAAEIDALMQQARRYEKEFLLTKSLIAVEKHKKILNTLIAAGEEISRIEDKNGKSSARAKKIITEAKNYQKHFEHLVDAQKEAGLDSTSGQRGVLKEAAQQIAKTLIEHNADDLLISLLQMRRTEMKYLASDKENDKEKFIASIAAFSAILKQSACDPVAQKAQTKSLAKYNRWLTEYFETDDTVYRDDINSSMQELALKIEGEINSIRVPNTKALLLEIQTNEKDFLLSLDPIFIDQTHNAISNLQQAFEQANIQPEHVAATKEQLIAYQAAFAAMTVEFKEMASAQETMNKSVQNIEPLVKEIYQSSIKRSENATSALLDNSGNMSKIALITGFIALVLAIGVAFFLARSITGPIRQTVEGLTGGAEQVSAAAAHISSSSQSLADGATSQAASIEQTSASMEELTSMTNQNADNADHADSLMKEVITVIHSADTSMDKMSNSMEEISKASEETSKIVKTIDEIAFQTNLLALNAAVEAARAGEAGAGFAVVADEVRNLAMRAADAAKNTSELIEGIVNKVDQGKKIVSQTNSSFSEVAQASAKVGNLVAEISNASREQAQGLDHMNSALTQMETVTQRNSASAEESAAASTELNSQANMMMNMVQGLSAVVEGNNGKYKTTINLPATASNTSTRQQENKLKSLPSSSAKQKVASVKADEIIPMDDDEDFEDF